MPKPPKSFMAQAKDWARRNHLFGPQAFLKYVMLNYLDILNRVSDDFVFKGGNLLWVYIQTPRATVDLDLATLTMKSSTHVKRVLEKACTLSENSGISYSIVSFEEVLQDSKHGAFVTLKFQTDQGATNTFDMDIVYELETDTTKISSPLDTHQKIKAATIENIIADKIAALHRFGSGSTRIKDLDDLWRLSEKAPEINKKRLAQLLRKRKISGELKSSWISDIITTGWARHLKRYKDLPETPEELFVDVNRWLKKVLK